MDQTILLFLHKGIKNLPSLSFPISILEGIIEHTLRRNKTIHRNRTTAPRFILSANPERTKRIDDLTLAGEPASHSRERYINAGECKGHFKNPYQVVLFPMNGGDRPC